MQPLKKQDHSIWEWCDAAHCPETERGDKSRILKAAASTLAEHCPVLAGVPVDRLREILAARVKVGGVGTRPSHKSPDGLAKELATEALKCSLVTIRRHIRHQPTSSTTR
jgi:hypothetical protein